MKLFCSYLTLLFLSGLIQTGISIAQSSAASPSKAPDKVLKKDTGASAKTSPKAKKAGGPKKGKKKGSVSSEKKQANAKKSTGSTNPKTKPAKKEAKVKSPAAALKKLNLKLAKQLLYSKEKDKVLSGINHLKKFAKPSVVPLLTDRMEEGLPPHLMERAIEVLVAAKHSRAGPVLIQLCNHRRASIRQAAVKALGQLKIRTSFPQLIESLDDSDEGVRLAAIEALGHLGDRKALKDLFRLFERGSDEAVKAIAQLANQKDLDKLIGYLEGHPFRVLKPAFSELLDKRAVPLHYKLQLVSRLGKNGKSGIKQFLQDYLQKLPERNKKQMTTALAKAIESVNQAERADSKVESESSPKEASKAQEATP